MNIDRDKGLMFLERSFVPPWHCIWIAPAMTECEVAFAIDTRTRTQPAPQITVVASDLNDSGRDKLCRQM